MSYPPFNHSREDSPLHPCEECAAAMSGQIARQNQLLQLILGFATAPAAVPLALCDAPALTHRLDSIREMITAELRGEPSMQMAAGPTTQSEGPKGAPAARFIRITRWRWWYIFWPSALKQYIDDTAKLHGVVDSVDAEALVAMLTEAIR